MSQLISYLWLTSGRGLSPYQQNRLLAHFGTAEAVFAADQAAYKQVAGLSAKQVEMLCDKQTQEAEQLAARCAREGIRILTLSDGQYPDRLRALIDPPLVLYVRGNLPDLDSQVGIAVVGTRRATAYGLKTAEQIGRQLGQADMIAISGMALGIDSAAQRGALRAGGLTVAVLACGVNLCYPPEHQGLMQEILLQGAVISEYPPDTPARAQHYHNRNRIISGLSVAAVVVEAGDSRSGALITVRHALDQGRDVYAVPGAIDAPSSAACNRLIAEGEAQLLYDPRVLVRSYSGEGSVQSEPLRTPQVREKRRSSPETPQKRNAKDTESTQEVSQAPKAPAVPLSEEEQLIYELVGKGYQKPDELVEQSGLSVPRVMGLITMMEINGVLTRDKGILCIK